MLWRVERVEIIEAVRWTAKGNGGSPLGAVRFEAATGIGARDWLPYWSRFGDVQREAGFEPNKLNAAYPDELLFDKTIELMRELGKYPTARERRTKSLNDVSHPDSKVFERLGNKAQFISKLAAYCADKPEHADMVALLESLIETSPSAGTDSAESTGTVRHGFVYLLKGRPGQYKIGHTDAPGRRQFELSAGASTELDLVHKIETDDPKGVETYWHTRFAAQCTHREWFKLSATDVKAFKRWRRIY
jgi:Meiotically up-regulated gene 113